MFDGPVQRVRLAGLPGFQRGQIDGGIAESPQRRNIIHAVSLRRETQRPDTTVAAGRHDEHSFPELRDAVILRIDRVDRRVVTACSHLAENPVDDHPTVRVFHAEQQPNIFHHHDLRPHQIGELE